MAQATAAAFAAAATRSTAAHKRGLSHSPGMPIDCARSAGPTNSRSTSGAGLQRPHHRGVVGGVEPHEGPETHAAGRAGGLLDLGDRQADVFLVEPDGVVAAVLADDLDQLGVAELAGAENARQTPLAEAF